jgi:hypothetical protein
MLGMSAALWGVAWLLEARSARDAIRIALMAAFLGVTHVQAVAYLGTAVVALLLVQRPFKRALVIHTLSCTGFVVTIMPWLIQRWTLSSQQGSTKFTFGLDSVTEKLASFFKFTFDNQPDPTIAGVTGAAFLLFLFGAPLLASLPQAREESTSAGSSVSHPGAALVLVLVPLVLYLALPMTISGPVSHWYTYPRYATFALLALLFLPRARFTGRAAFWLLPGVLCAVVLQVCVTKQFADYATRARPFLQIIAQVKPNSAYLPLELDDSDPATVLPTTACSTSR